MKSPYQFRMERAGIGLLHLGSEEVGETLGGEAVDVVDGVAFPGQGVDEHPGARCHGRFGDLQSKVLHLVFFLLSMNLVFKFVNLR